MVTPVTDPDVLAGYLSDASNTKGRAEALVRPRSTEEVAEVLAYCTERGICVTVSGGRSGTVGGARPDGGWVLSTELLRATPVIEPDRATAEAGHNLGALQDTLLATGRLYPPDPTSRYDCFFGGSIATNASGARSFRYGATRRWVEGLTVVLPDGTVRHIGPEDLAPPHWPVPSWSEPAVKTAAGYAPSARLLDLFVGQEGTLGVITVATVRLLPRPVGPIGLVAFFGDKERALAAVVALRTAAHSDPHGLLSACSLEWLDETSLGFARQRAVAVPNSAVVALMCEQEVEAECGEDAHLEAWITALAQLGADADHTLVAIDDAGREGLRALRHAIPAGINEIVTRNGMPKVGTDLAVPDAALPELMRRYEQAPGRSVLFGHVGDNHLHLNLLPRSADELAQARAYYDELARYAISVGGTVSGEHGIGKLKRSHLAWMVGDATLASFRALKNAVDPANILGRGTLME